MQTYARWGEGTVKHLERLGVLDKNLLAVHTVWLTDEELELFRKREVKISHNPASAMRVLGFARIPKMLEMGLRPSIGTDGASSSNHMDMVDEMWLTSLIHKGWRLDPTVVPSQDILRMATKWGARALLDEELYGSHRHRPARPVDDAGERQDRRAGDGDALGEHPVDDVRRQMAHARPQDPDAG